MSDSSDDVPQLKAGVLPPAPPPVQPPGQTSVQPPVGTPHEPPDGPPIWGGRATWQITLRWIVPPAILIGVLFGHVLGYEFAVVPILLVAAFVQTYNVAFWLVYVVGKRGHASVNGRCSPRPAVAQVALDYAAMIVLVYYTGGVASPLLFFFVFHVIFAAVVLDARLAWLFAMAAVASLAVLWAGEAVGLLAPIPITYQGESCGPFKAAHGFLTILFFGVTVLVVAAETTALVRRMRREHARRVDAAAAMADERSRMILQVEHNLRSPLTASVSMLDVVADEMLGPLTEGQLEYLRRVRRRLMTLNEMVGELLHLARRRAAAKDAAKMPCQMAPLLVEVCKHFADQAADLGVSLDADAPERLDPVLGDVNELRQMLENLVSNAIKYTPEGGSVTATLSRGDPGTVVVRISDTGIGIPESEQDKLFDEFYRAPNGRITAVDGTGLGLAIVKQTVEQHGGTVRIESAVGEGTTVTVVLPTAAGTDGRTAA